MEEKNKTCCFFGHRKIAETEELKKNLYEKIESLIIHDNVNTFLFGSRSEFDKLCLDIVTDLKKKHTHIKRIYVRAEYLYISDKYRKYLLKSYEDTYFPKSALRAGKAVYIKRNFDMIDNSDFCIVYYKENYSPPQRKSSADALNSYTPQSGTKMAYEYAVKKEKNIIIFDC